MDKNGKKVWFDCLVLLNKTKQFSSKELVTYLEKLELSEKIILKKHLKTNGKPLSNEFYSVEDFLFFLIQFFIGDRSFSTFAGIVRAGNYLKDNFLSKIIETYWKLMINESDADKKIYLLKYIAKYYKDSGEYENAVVFYEKLFAEAKRIGNNEMYYSLAILAKFYNDYQQRIGWHFALHEISYTYFQDNNNSLDDSRWEIVQESYFKVLFSQSPAKAVSHYELSGFSEKKRHRWFFHLSEGILDHYCNTGETLGNEEIPELINKYVTEMELLLPQGNNIAYIVRLCYVSMLIRRILTGNKELELLDTTELLRYRRSVKGRIRKRKIYYVKHKNPKIIATINRELIGWILLSDKHDKSNLNLVKDWIEENLNLVHKNNVYLVPFVFEESLVLAMKYFQGEKEWERAFYLSKIYIAFSKSIAKQIYEDEINIQKSFEGEDSTFSLLNFLDKKDKKFLLNSIKQDYEYRMKNLFDSLDQVEKIFFWKNISDFEKYTRNVLDWNVHNLSRYVNQIESDRENPELVLNHCKLMNLHIGSVYEEKISLLAENIILKPLIDEVLENFKVFELGNCKITNSIEEEIVVKFGRSNLISVVYSLIDNSVEFGELKRLTKITIDLSFEEIGGIGYLVIGDNVGGEVELKKILQAVNNNNQNKVTSSKDRGRGLVMARKTVVYYAKKQDVVFLLDIKKDYKSIKIPLKF